MTVQFRVYGIRSWNKIFTIYLSIRSWNRTLYCSGPYNLLKSSNIPILHHHAQTGAAKKSNDRLLFLSFQFEFIWPPIFRVRPRFFAIVRFEVEMKFFLTSYFLILRPSTLNFPEGQHSVRTVKFHWTTNKSFRPSFSLMTVKYRLGTFHEVQIMLKEWKPYL